MAGAVAAAAAAAAAPAPAPDAATVATAGTGMPMRMRMRMRMFAVVAVEHQYCPRCDGDLAQWARGRSFDSQCYYCDDPASYRCMSCAQPACLACGRETHDRLTAESLECDVFEE